ncbi:Hypothetical predicted protein [Paramuricea clavata]|uniref:Uncharacterized protein n=1 Tax=Paramuricea clavata TaxID=317549 RepID=A0A6S7FTN8_PARCT|nr:Hypothetical predicted protein [Paramuricea clavata]
MSKEDQESLRQENKSSHDESQSKDFEKEEKSLFNANELKDGQQEYKCLLIVNESKEAKLTLYIYPVWSLFCKVSESSKIIQPNERVLHRKETGFKFEIVANFGGKRETKKLLGPLKWVEDKLIKVTEALDCTQENLANFPEEKRVCLRKIYRRKELKTTCGGLNLYEILGLNMKENRKKNIDDQKAAIKKAFREKMRIWHPDKNFGDHEIAMQIIVARETLLDDERRARYHNEADYDAGWLSLRRFKAIFWPECFTDKQNEVYWRRIGLLTLSLGITVGGIVLTACTAGAAAPPTVVFGAIFGSGFIGGGIQSFMHAVNKESIVDECDVKSWLLKLGIGFAGGAITGGVAVGITAGVVGIGKVALESGTIAAGQFLGVGAGTGAVGGVASSLASDAGRAFVDGENITAKQALLRAGCSGVIGAGAGALGGLATQGIVSRQASAATATLQGDIGEQVVVLTGARRLGNTLAREVSRQLAESGTEAIMGTATQFVEERLDDSVENQHPMEHVVRGVKNVAINAVKGTAVQGAGTLVSHGINEVKVKRQVRHTAECNKTVIRRKARYDLSLENNEHRANWKSVKGSSSYEPICQPTNVSTNQPDDDESQATTPTSDEGEADEPQEGTIKYISEGAWLSKMIITYSLNGEESEAVESDSDSIVKIPAGATQIEVKFKVSRPSWGDIMKYDRFEKTWCKPDEPHVFRYEKPPIRTFTVSGGLWWEAVMRVSDEYHEETREMS